MTPFLKNTIILSSIIFGLRILGGYINKLSIWDYLTQFFVFIRTLTAPVNFIWDFDTSWQIITIILGILIAYSAFQAILIVRDNYKS